MTNANGSATYTFNAATIAAAGGHVPFPTGTITSIDVLVDVQGSADLTAITVNGMTQIPVVSPVGPPTSKDACKHDGWKTFNNPAFKNQGQCVSYVASHGHKQHHHNKQNHGKQHNEH